MNHFKLAHRASLAFVLVAASLTGCSGNNTPDGGNDASDIATNDVVRNDVTTADGSDVVTTTDGDTDVVETDAQTDVPTDTTGCTGDGGCWACAPTTDLQYLNHCTGSSCSHFDNTRATRLQPDGGLPPLP